MVTVRRLISVLKKMPQDLEVGVAMHDNGEHEVAGWVSSVNKTTDDYDPENKKRCVVLHC